MNAAVYGRAFCRTRRKWCEQGRTKGEVLPVKICIDVCVYGISTITPAQIVGPRLQIAPVLYRHNYARHNIVASYIHFKPDQHENVELSGTQNRYQEQLTRGGVGGRERERNRNVIIAHG